MFNCRVCNNSKLELSEMKKEPRLVESKRGICKACATEYEKLRLARSKADYQPEKHLTCNDCDRVFSNRNTGPNRILLRVHCPFCKSEEIERY
jgi:hypothetical protein